MMDLNKYAMTGGILPRERERLGVFLDFVTGLAGMSTCKRLQVGCMVVTPDLSEVIGIGYNGPPAGLPNDGCRGGEGVCGCIHADANALVKLGSIRSDLVMIITHSPCEHCAGLVIDSRRIRSVLYMHSYRDPVGLRILEQVGIETRQVSRNY